MENKTFLIVLGTPQNKEALLNYQEASASIMKHFGAKLPPNKLNINTRLVGSSRPKFMMKVEFPSPQHIKDAFNHPDYLAIVKDRDEGLSDLHIFIANE
ncbi:DUF1330 domain-containing protein [uncultured Shewanella sp.]|uniref:DUF1330 domain-containing protein n=1 Tax=uncultured Shewanella sp. TaxID=173975 RepID=UPI002637E18E|nr:DUF1330 domain-containing protein [uncultured Shewanella sp.]